MMESNKVLITLPHPNYNGGVGHIFKVLRLDKNGVEYFYNTEKGRSANLFFFLKMLIRFLFRMRRKSIVHFNPSLDFKAIFRDGILLLFAKLFRKKVIVFLHGWDDGFEERIARNYFYRWFFLFAFDMADVYLLLGQVFRQKLTRLGIRIKECHFIPTVADDLFVGNIPENSHIHEKEETTLLFIAGFVPNKGMDIVLKSFLQLTKMCSSHRLKLIMAGDGPELNKCKQFVEDNHVHNVHFTGFVSGERKHTCFQNSHILFFPSLYGEGLPCVIMEAMLYGLTIVTRPIGGIPDWVKHYKNGWLSESTDPGVFADGIYSIISQPGLLKTFRENNRNIALNNFTPGRVKKTLLDIYKS